MNHDLRTYEEKRRVSLKAAAKRHAAAQNNLLRIGGEILTMGEVCARTGLDGSRVRAKYRKGHRNWSDYGIVT